MSHYILCDRIDNGLDYYEPIVSLLCDALIQSDPEIMAEVNDHWRGLLDCTC